MSLTTILMGFLFGIVFTVGIIVTAAFWYDITDWFGKLGKRKLPSSLNDSAPEPEPFEVNMMEPLVGWKGWKLGGDGLLHSHYNDWPWRPDKPTEAGCPNCLSNGRPLVNDSDGCGIHAADAPQATAPYGSIRGEVYGWGRYVRGNLGWRAQFAYPKAFYLTRDQGSLIEPLRKYHVPIFIDEPLRVYDPDEEGFSNGYWDSEAKRDFGTIEDSDSTAT